MTPPSPPKALPLLYTLRSSRIFTLLTISLAIFTDIFTYGVIVPLMPFTLSHRCGVPSSHLEIYIAIFLAIYGTAFLLTSLITGVLADRTASHRTPMLVGLLAQGVSTVGLCMARSVGAFAVARAAQGVSAGVVWVVALALLVDTVGVGEVGFYMAYVGICMNLGLLLGPLLGGFVFEVTDYVTTFSMIFVLVAADIVMRLAMIEPRSKTQKGDETIVDSHQTATTKGLAKSNVTPSSHRKTPQTDIETQPLLIPEPLNHQVDATIDELNRTSKHPATTRLPPILTLLTSPRILSAIWASLIYGATLTSFDTILPAFVKKTYSWHSPGAALVFVPINLPSFLGPPIGHICDRYGARWIAVAGFMGCGPFLILLRFAVVDDIAHQAVLFVLLTGIGVTLTMQLTAMMAEISYAVEAEAGRRGKGFLGGKGVYAQAYALFNMAWSMGFVAGPLAAGVLERRVGWEGTYFWLGVFGLVTVVPVWVFTGCKAAGRQEVGEQD